VAFIVDEYVSREGSDVARVLNPDVNGKVLIQAIRATLGGEFLPGGPAEQVEPWELHSVRHLTNDDIENRT